MEKLSHSIEQHPLEPFLPSNARLLFLGSFPPPQARWSMNFFYPNWINDFWRIQGVIHYNNKQHFELGGKKQFDKERIVAFCHEKGIALFDTAKAVRRLKDNADDNFLEIVEGTDVFALLEQMPECNTIVTTGGKASEELQKYLESHDIKVKIPKVGECIQIEAHLPSRLSDKHENTTADNQGKATAENQGKTTAEGRELTTLHWWRMPSSSRAYPMKLEKKAENYRLLFE